MSKKLYEEALKRAAERDADDFVEVEQKPKLQRQRHYYKRTQLTDEERMNHIFLAFQTERTQEHFAEEARRKLKNYPCPIQPQKSLPE